MNQTRSIKANDSGHECVREGLKSVMEIPWNVISAPAAPKAKASEEVVFAK